MEAEEAMILNTFEIKANLLMISVLKPIQPFLSFAVT